MHLSDNSLPAYVGLFYRRKGSAEVPGIYQKITKVEIVPLTKTDVEEAARMNPSKTDLLDALIASCVRRNDGCIWTKDNDLLKFLGKDQVKIESAVSVSL